MKDMIELRKMMTQIQFYSHHLEINNVYINGERIVYSDIEDPNKEELSVLLTNMAGTLRDYIDKVKTREISTDTFYISNLSKEKDIFKNFIDNSRSIAKIYKKIYDENNTAEIHSTKSPIPLNEVYEEMESLINNAEKIINTI